MLKFHIIDSKFQPIQRLESKNMKNKTEIGNKSFDILDEK